MKLRNKKTGEIGKLHCDMNVSPAKYGVFEDTGIRGHYWEYNSLAELNEEWQDYEEDELLYIINADYKEGYQCVLKEQFPAICKVAKDVGIGFESEKECREAVEKLKAWKRLKDKGFVWQGWEEGAMDNGMCVIGCQIPENNWDTDVVKDLDGLFGGEE